MSPALPYSQHPKQLQAHGCYKEFKSASAFLLLLLLTFGSSKADTLIFNADFDPESSSPDNVWTTDPTGADTAVAGAWAIGIQAPYDFDSTQVQLAPFSGGNLATGLGPSNSGETGDVDGGDTTVISPVFTVPAGVDQVQANFNYYFGYRSGDSSDYFRLHLVDSTTDSIVQTLVLHELTGVVSTNAVWRSVTSDITSLGGTSVYFLAEASDAGGGSIVEAAIDNVSVISRDRIEGTVYYDVDGDGDLSDTNMLDRGGNGVAVQLFADNGSGTPTGPAIETIVTSNDGAFSFAGPSAGDYVILATDNAGTTSTADSSGANDNKILVSYSGVGISNGHLFLDTITYSASSDSVASYYLPYREDNIETSLATIYDETSCASGVPEAISPIQSYNSISVAFDNTIIYYDHYEDNTLSGYETDVRIPTQRYTEVWGDGIPLNGVAPGDTDDLLNTGEVIVLSDAVDTSALGTDIVYGGRDKFASTKYVAATRASWASGSNTLLAGAWELFDTARWGQRYVLPIGFRYMDDTAFASDEVFEYVGGSIMASQDDTEIRLNGNLVATLDEGEEYFVNGGTAAGFEVGDVITATNDVQMHLVTGNICATYESRWYTLTPAEAWSTSYISPVSSASGSGTDVWLFYEGPNATTTVTRTIRSGGTLTTLDIPVTQGIPISDTIPDGSAAQYETGIASGTSGDVFYALVAVDADLGSTENSTHDWGHSLIPENQLSVLAVAGLAPGDDPTYAGSNPENSAPLWVTAVYPQGSPSTGDITVYVDYNGDGTTHPSGGIDSNTGLAYDQSFTIAELARLKVFVDADGDGTTDIADQTATRVWTSGGDALIAIAYGQDPNTASVGSPAVDMGTTVPGIPLLIASIGCTIINDLNGNGLVDLGDTVDYEINVENAGAGVIDPDTVTVVNVAPSEIDYVANSATINDGDLVAIPDDTSGSLSPIDESGYTYSDSLTPAKQFTIRFESTVTTIPANGTITNIVNVIGLTNTVSAVHTFNYNPSPEVSIITTAGSTPDGDIHKLTTPGNVTYTYTITNEGLSHLADLVITDDNGTPSDASDDIVITSVECPDLAGPLAPNATIVCASPPRLISSDTTNTASVTGNPVNALGEDLDGVDDPSDDDPAIVALVGSISNFVWSDLDGDGIQDSGEVGLAGATVRLIDPLDDSVLETATTTGTGLYSFTQLLAGDYIVEFEPPANHILSPPSASGSTTANDSDPDTTTQRVNVTLSSGENDDTIDAGMYQPVSIGNLVWNDINGDGIKAPSEAGIDGVTVRLYNSSLVELDSTTTVNGIYNFTNLVAGTYVIHVDAPTGWLFSPLNQGGNDALDSDVAPSTGNTSTYTLAAGTTNDSVDAGLYNPGSISNLVWNDINGDGIKDVSEPGLDGVTVNLLDPGNSDAILDTTTTSGGGLYSFDGLLAGTYAVQFVPSSAYSFSPQTASGATPATDSNPSPITGRTDDISIIAGENDDTIDAGVYVNSSISDLVWDDSDADGIKDPGEAGLDNVTVRLLDPSNGNAVLQSTTTNSSGFYAFNDLVSGNYVVEFVTPSGYARSPFKEGSDGTVDSDAALASGRTDTITLSLGEDNTAIDAGFYRPSSLSNYVWDDANGDGIQDSGETGIADVTVRLLDPNNSFAVLDSTLTSSSGLYSFSNLKPGDYVLEFVTPTGFDQSPVDAGSDDAIDSDANPSTGRTSTITLADNEDDDSWDAGFYQPASLSDLVWDDYDGDGVQDSGEPGLDGVTVRLLDPDNSFAVISSDTTTMGGIYSFNGLDPGDYVVEFVLPDGYIASPQDSTNGTNATDSDAHPLSGRTDTVTLSSGEDNDSIDAGFYQPGSISNFVWYDLNADGLQSSGEPGLDGITVRLLDTSSNELATTTTSNGLYSFTNLGRGDYVIDVESPGVDWVPSPVNAGTDTAIDSDASVTTGETATISLGIAEDNDSIDAGFYRPAIVSNRVWNDIDGNGLQGNDEPGVSGVTVRLYASSDLVTPIGTTSTDANGIYYFDNLAAGSYILEFVSPGAGWDRSIKDAGSDDALDSDADQVTGFTDTIVLAAGDANDSVDAGFYMPPSLGNYVWSDNDNDGIQDSGEPGINGVTVRLLDADTLTEVDSTVTATDSNGPGYYLFQGFVPDTYIIEFVKPNGYNTVTQSAGSDTTADSDADATTGRTAPIVVESGAMILDIDAGFFPPATISNYVWDDVDADGIQDSGELGIDGVTVRLLDASDNSLITSTITAGGGFYSFPNLQADDYVVEFITPTNYTISPQSVGSDSALDSDINTSNGRTATITLAAGETNDSIDAGYFRPGTLSDYVWNDLDADGVQEIGEPALGGVTVNLLDATNGNALIDSTVSHATTGLYSFTNLGAGTSRYTLEFIAPAGFTASPTDQGGNDNVDSDANTSNGRTAALSLAAGQTRDDLDAGFFEYATIGDFVWTDTNGNGIQDGGEPGLSGVTVRLLNSSTLTQINSTTTNGSGLYTFSNVPAGSYVIEFTTPTGLTPSPQDSSATTDALDSDANPSTGRTETIVVNAGDSIDTIDAGFFSPGTLGNYVWEDANGDGVQDVTEDGLIGVTVNLLDADNSFAQIDSTTTIADGTYSFTNLPTGNYVVEFVLPSGYTFSPTANGGTSATDSDADTSTGRSSTIALSVGETDDSIDAGLYQPGTISDFVWHDVDADGIQDLNETSGVAGVEVQLLDAAGSPISTTYTDATGAYSFTDLAPGDYKVMFLPPAGYVLSPQDNVSATDATDSDPDLLTHTTSTISVSSGDIIDNVDAGFSIPAAIGNYVWLDENADGVQDAGEPGIPGVKVDLFDATGSILLQTTTTDALGGYLFSNLTAGSYVVRVDTTNSSLYASLSANPTYDEDNGTTAPNHATRVEVSAGQEHLSADFGYHYASVAETDDPSAVKEPLGAIGDRIWSDDGDGIQEPGEPGIPNVTVTLLKDTNGDGIIGGTGDLAETTTTDASGLYFFDGLETGAYMVSVTTASLPSGFVTTPTGDPDGDGDNVSNPILIAPGDVFLNADFGYTNPDSLSLGDLIYVDTDADGQHDLNEPGIARVTVELLVGGDVQATTTTDNSGNYLFTGLRKGTDYTVRITDTEHVLGNLVQTGDPDSPLTPNGQSTVTNLLATDLDQDFGYAPAAHTTGAGFLGDTVFLDLNGNNNLDPGEGFEGITVYLDANGNLSRDADERYTITDENGNYYFGGLDRSATYKVAVDTTTLPIGLTNTVDPDTLGTGDDGSTVDLSIDVDGIDLDQDFGYAATVPNTVSGTIWTDTDADGLLKETNAGIDGVTVDLYLDPNGDGDLSDAQLVGTTTTSGGGDYSFGGLPDGNYIVDVTDSANVLEGYWHTLGSSPGVDSHSQTDTYSILNLSDGTTNATADFGYYRDGASLGDTVWEDVNSDGEQNESGTGIANATVTLTVAYPTGGTVILETTTNSSGNYSFGNLLLDEDFTTATAGDNTDPSYTVAFTTPTGYLPTHPGAGTASTDSNGTSDSNIDLKQGENDDTIDSGFVAPGSLASIGDLVWNDTNGDGIKDDAEAGLEGVTVNLYDDSGTLQASDVTDSAGAYFFGSLLAGDYTVEFVPPSGYEISPQNAGFPNDDSTDSDADPATYRTATVTLSAGENESDVDAGLFAPAVIGNYVWVDENGDGVQDAGEPGIPNVTVELFDGPDLIASTTTDALGGYLFSGLVPGTYEVRVDASTLGTSLAANPTYNEDTGTTAPDNATSVAVTAGDEHLTADFGYNHASPAETGSPSISATGAIGDRIWNDVDQDGTQDPGESGLANVSVSLLVDSNGDGLYGGTPAEILASTSTDASGNYIFDGLPEGAYVIEVDTTSLPSSFVTTPSGDPDGDGDSTSAPLILAPGDVFLNADFGYHSPTGFTIGDIVYLDQNGDGTYDVGELGIAGVTLALWQGSHVIATTITDSSGNYSFPGLEAGLDYTVKITDTSNVLGEWVQVGDPDSPFSPDGESTVTNLAADDLDQDFGYAPAGHGLGEGLLGDTVFLDSNGDGTPNFGEGLESVVLFLDLNHDGTRDGDEPSTKTNENGTYAFGGLNPSGTYTVVIDTTTLNSGLTNSVDPDDGLANQASLVLAGTDLEQDFGYIATAANTIAGTIWEDTDADGLLDETGTSLAGVTVALYSDPNGDGDPSDGQILGTAETDSSGNYTFANLPDGNYIIDVTDDANLLEGFWHSIGPNAGDGSTDLQSQLDTYSVISLSGGTTNATGDFGYYRAPASLGNYVWDDTNADGIQNDGATGFVGSLVTLTIAYPNGDSLTATTITEANGTYSFGNLLADEDFNTATAGDNSDPNYTITFAQPSGFVPTRTGAGTPTTDSNGTSESAITLAQGDLDNSIDSGFVGPASQASLGDLVWLDSNGDGVQDPSETTGIANVRVRLLDPNDSFAVLAETTTDSSGAYVFSNLAPNDYVVEFLMPSGYAPSPQDSSGTAESADSDADPFTGRTDSLTLTAGSNNDDIDAGFYIPGAIGDRIWVDEDADGVQDIGEPGIPGVTVNLLDGDGTGIIATTTTDAEGNYLFTQVAPGSYVISVDPSSFASNLAANQTYDADGLADHETALTVAAGDSNLSADFGYNWSSASDTNTPTASSATGAIGDRVWLDIDGDGLQDAGEVGLAGIDVSLLVDSNGDGIYGGTGDSPSVTATTDAYGNYLFDGLNPGGYIVEVDSGDLPVGATQTGDPDATADHQTSQAIVLGPGDTFLNADFGYQPATSYAIGDTIYLDSNLDGTLSPGESEIPGVTIVLLSGNEVVASTQTNADGTYLFPGVLPGTYTVWVNDTANLLNNLRQTGDPDSLLDRQSTVTIAASDDLDQDFGFAPTNHRVGDGYIGDTLFLDRNGNDTNDAGEGLGGVIVELYDASGINLLASTETNAFGQYSFGGLDAAESYVVSVDTTSLPNNGTALTNTVDPDTASPGDSVSSVNLALQGGIDLDQDFGYIANVANSLAGTIWEDTDAEGDLDEISSGLEAITVDLFDGNGNLVAVTHTSTSGDYSFTGLPDGNYTVVVSDRNNLLEGYWDTLGLLPGADNNSQTRPYLVNLDAGGSDPNAVSNTTADFGYYRELASVGDTVWEDTDGDGTQNEVGTGIAGVLVSLTIDYPNGDQVAVHTVTDSTGNFSFGNLLADEDEITATSAGTDPTYTLTFATPNTYVPTQTGQGTAATDSNGSTTAVTLAQGVTDNTYDSGFVAPAAQASIGDLVWTDTNGDGVKDPDEQGEAGIVIRLMNPGPDGLPGGGDDLEVASTTSDGNGAYSFTTAPGNYFLEFDAPSGSNGFTQQDNGSDDTSDSDVNPATGQTAVTTLTAGESDDTIDAGLILTKPDGFAAWQTNNPLGGQNGPTDNPDGDLYDNFLEYALCLHPDSGVPNHDGFCVEHTAGQFDVVFRRATGGLSDLTYTVQGRSTLPTSGDTTWTTLAAIPGQGAGTTGAVITNLGNGSEEVRLTNLQTMAPLTTSAGFTRLLVSDGTNSSTTLVQGWLETVHGANQCATYSVPFQKKEAVSGTITSVVFNSLNVSESANLSAVLDLANKSYYLEVISGDHEGHRFDIIGAGNGTLSLASDGNVCAGPPHNTLTDFPPTLAGDQFVVREHYTIDELFPPAAPFTAGATASAADRLLFYSDKWDIYYLDSETDPSVWQLDGEAFGDYGSTTVPPSHGLFLHPRSTAVSLLSVGVVRQNAFALPLNSGYTLLPSIYPIDQSPADRLLLTGYGDYDIDGGFDPSQSDQISIWDGDTGVYVEGYTAFFHLQGAGGAGFPDGWRDSSDAFLSPHTGTDLFLRDRSAFLLRRSEDCDPSYIMPTPWAP